MTTRVCGNCGLSLDEPSLGWVGPMTGTGVAVLTPDQQNVRYHFQGHCEAASWYWRGHRMGYDEAARQINAATHEIKP